SDLLQPFVERVGRTARFGFATTPDRTQDGVQGVAWRLIADNVESSARGLIRTSDRTAPEGISLEINSPALSRLVGRPIAGPAALSGRRPRRRPDLQPAGRGALAERGRRLLPRRAHLGSGEPRREQGPL